MRDRWGVPHIYAQYTEDLFFAQGYVMAQDRLWQMEMWRAAPRAGSPRCSAPARFARDRQARLLKYRGPIDDREWTSYHPEARRIMTAYVAGVNAFIDEATAAKLPVEFVLDRHHGRSRGRSRRCCSARPRSATRPPSCSSRAAWRSSAPPKPTAARNPDPCEELVVPDGLDVAAIGDAVLAATRGGGGAPRPHGPAAVSRSLAARSAGDQPDTSVREPGSNNWVVSGAMSATGKPVVANDPHREVAQSLAPLHRPPERAGLECRPAPSSRRFSASPSVTTSESGGD